MAGLTATGITIKSVDDILADIEAEQLANIDSQLNLGPDDVLGQLNGIMAASVAEVWELLEEIYHSAYPDTASGQSLSYVSALTGAVRDVATRAELDVRFTGTDTTQIPAGTKLYPEDDADSLFQTTALATISGTTVDVTVQAVDTGSGPTAAAGDTLVISTPVSGISGVATIGATPFAPGQNEETDSLLRIRREQGLALGGTGTVDGIRADMLTVRGVDSCTVFENTTLQTDGNGVPGKAIEVLVYSEAAPAYTDAAVAAQIWASKPAGTEAYGLDGPHTVIDTSGNQHEVYFSEPTVVPAYVEVTLVKTADGSYGTDTGTAKSIADWALRSLKVGQSLYASDIVNVVADLTGVDYVDIGAVFVDDDAVPSPNTSLVVTARGLITINFANVTVTSI